MIHLSNAKFCIDCEVIHREQLCPKCKSKRSFKITRWFGLLALVRQAPITRRHINLIKREKGGDKDV